MNARPAVVGLAVAATALVYGLTPTSTPAPVMSATATTVLDDRPQLTQDMDQITQDQTGLATLPAGGGFTRAQAWRRCFTDVATYNTDARHYPLPGGLLRHLNANDACGDQP